MQYPYSYIFDDYELINRARKLNGLSPIIRKIVNCLRCKKEFLSRDYPRNRVCPRCSKYTENDPMDMYGNLAVSIPSSNFES